MKRFLLVLACLAMLLHSCVSEHEFGNEKQDVNVSTRAVVSEDASDPYRLESMQMALDDICADNASMTGVILTPTDYYVSFYPSDTTQVATLIDSGIEIFYHPLDVTGGWEDVEFGDASNFPCIYTVVPVDFIFPEGIEYKINYGVFIQNNDVATRSESAEQQLPSELYEQVLKRSMQLTGNLLDTKSTIKEDKWHPAVTVKYDSGYGIRPLPNVKVKANNYTNVVVRHTDENGETGPMQGIVGKVNYEIAWQCCCWNIHYVETANLYTTLLDTARLEPIEVVLNKEFDGHGQAAALAGIQRGLQAYFHEDHPLARTLRKPERINVALLRQYNEKFSGEYNPARRNRIFIWGLQDPDDGHFYKDAYMCTEVVTHELGHASHHELKPLNYDAHAIFKNNCNHCESWANGVEYAYMESIYPGYTITPSGTAYTRLVECLMHQGLTLAEIQESFVAGGNWWGWRDELKSRTSLEDRIIDVIFEFPNNYTFNLQDFIASDNKSYNKGELVYFLRKAEVPSNYEIVDWEIVGGDGIIMDETWSQMAAVFDGTGYKTIRASIQVDNDYIFTCEKQVFISDTDIFVNQMPNYTYDDVYCKISTKGDNIRQVSWDASDDNQYQTGRGVHFHYTASGVKTLNFTVTYNPLSDSGKSIDVEYEREIIVEDLPDLYSFELMDEPPYKAETKYELRYKRTDEQIEILTYELNHYRYRIYTPFSYWNFDVATGIAEFKIPGDVSIPIDYNVRITYLRPGHTEPSQAVIPVADYERAPYPPERDWFNR